MSKKFNIHDWQSKQRLGEMQSMDFGPNCPQYDGPEHEGIMAKGNAMELANDASDVANMIGPNTNLPEWVESKITLAADYLNKVKDYLTHYDTSREKLAERDNSMDEGHGLSKKDTETLETLISQIEQGTIDSKKTKSFVKVLNFIIDSNIEVDQTKDLSKDKELEELNVTGTGVSFNAGSGEGYATPNAFGDDKKKKMKAYKSIGYKEI